MKTILVPTDFSTAASNSVRYAARLCHELKAKLILFHAYMLPIPVSEVPFVMVTAEELQKNNEDSLREEAEGIFEESGIEVETLVRMGLPTDEILDLEDEKNVDLVIMGIKGAEGIDKLMGSTTNDIIRKCRKPVLVVPEEIRFNGLQKISYATDFDFEMKLQCFEPLLALVRAFKAELSIVHIKKEGVALTANQNAGKSRLEAIWNNLDHKYRILEYPEFEKGLINYLGQEKADLIVVVAHHHNFIERMFGHHTTRELSERTKLPLLILQDKD
jgi:nucleotide-binding universal stress UspA family protein